MEGNPQSCEDPAAIKNMSLAEFINNPNVTGFHAQDSGRLRAYVENTPYARIGTELPGGYVIGYVFEDRFEQLILELQESFVAIRPTLFTLLDRESLESASIIKVQELPGTNLRGEGVLLGFVDTGIDYTHPAFLYEDGTSKIQYIWDQTIRGDSPKDMHFGSQYSQAKINEALASKNPFSVVPEQDTNGHGTFLASIAGGRENNNYIGAAPDAEIIAVKLKPASKFNLNFSAVPRGTTAVFTSDKIMLGIKFILDKADELNRPVVICIGLGSNFGDHAGRSFIEEYISHINTRRGIVIISAAGNEANARHHTGGRIPATGYSETIEVLVGENVSSFAAYIWNNALDDISAIIEAPSGQTIRRIPFEANTLYQRALALERATVTIGYFLLIDHFIYVQVQEPTPGIWRIILQGDAITGNGEFHAWLPITGLISPNVEFSNPSQFMTIVIPSTATGSIVLGAYNSHDNSLYAASSWGPTLVPKLAPDLVAPGVSVGGAVPGGYGAFSGTSIAAAITAGASAILLQWGIVLGNEPYMNSARVRALLILGCDTPADLQHPNVQWGYGSLNLLNSLKVLKGQEQSS